MSKKHEKVLVGIILSLVLLVFDYRFFLHPTISVYGFPRADYGPSLWNFWVTWRNLEQGNSPFWTTALFQGSRAGLFYHTLNLLYFVAAAPFFAATRNVFLAFNFSQVLADSLSLFCFYRLARQTGAARCLAVVGAMAFTFYAHRLQQHLTLNLQSTWLISLAALAMLKVWRKGKARDGILLGLTGIGLILGDWHCLLFTAMAAPFLVVWFAHRYQAAPARRASARRVLRAGLVAALVFAPVLAAYAVMSQRHAPVVDYAPYKEIGRVFWSASPLYYVMPGWLETRFFEWVGPLGRYETFSYKTQGAWALFLGVVTIALFLNYALARSRARKPSASAALSPHRTTAPRCPPLRRYCVLSGRKPRSLADLGEARRDLGRPPGADAGLLAFQTPDLLCHKACRALWSDGAVPHAAPRDDPARDAVRARA